jgi:serralysin
LLEGSGRLAGRYLVWDVDNNGVVQEDHGWFTGDQMMEQGYESSFDLDLNGDGFNGEPPAYDADGDGLVDGDGKYKMYRDGAAVSLRNQRGRFYSDASSKLWNVTRAIEDGDGFHVLVEGVGRFSGRYQVWDVGFDGLRTNTYGWFIADQMMQEGYESSFDRDFNDDGIIGVPPIVDADGDGLVDGGGSYRLIRDDSAVDLQSNRGRVYSDSTSNLWDVTKAVVDGDGYDVLLEGSGRLNGRYLIWEVDSEGVVNKSIGWSTSDRLTDLGFGDLFA